MKHLQINKIYWAGSVNLCEIAFSAMCLHEFTFLPPNIGAWCSLGPDLCRRHQEILTNNPNVLNVRG